MTRVKLVKTGQNKHGAAIGRKYFVRGGRRGYPMACHYRGLFPEGHLFTSVGDYCAGYYVQEKELANKVQAWSKEEQADIDRRAANWAKRTGMTPTNQNGLRGKG